MVPDLPYSLNLTPSLSFVAIRGRHFEDDEKVIRTVNTWLRELNKEWYQQGIHALASCWRKAIVRDGQYVKK